jgi:hypothetical protein
MNEQILFQVNQLNRLVNETDVCFETAHYIIFSDFPSYKFSRELALYPLNEKAYKLLFQWLWEETRAKNA